MKKKGIKKILIMTLVLSIISSVIGIADQVTGEQNPLIIDTSSSVMEGNNFFIIVTSNGVVMEDVRIEFLDDVYFTSLNGTVILAPLVDEDTSFSIYASKDGYGSAESTILVENIGEEQKLEIVATPVVNESEIFTVLVTNLQGDPISGALVILYNFSSLTDDNGIVQVIAPEVDVDTSYTIFADKNGYVSTDKSILVKNDEVKEKSFIYGNVLTEEGNPLEKAVVSVRLSIDDEINNFISLWKSQLTDENGEYSSSVLISGLVEIKAQKIGYESNIKTVEVAPGETIEISFTLNKRSYDPGELENQTLINDAIESGSVGGELTIRQSESSFYESDIMIYYDMTIELVLIEQGKISIIVGSDDHTGGKTITLNTELDIFDLDKDIFIEYDGEAIKMADDIHDILNPDDDGLYPEYLIIMGANGMQILFSVPHFSEHSITISSVAGSVSEVVEAIGGITAVILYITIFAIVAIIYIIPIFFVEKKK